MPRISPKYKKLIERGLRPPVRNIPLSFSSLFASGSYSYEKEIESKFINKATLEFQVEKKRSDKLVKK